MNTQQSSSASDPASVSQLWKFTPSSSEVYTPVVEDGFVYVTSQNVGGLPMGIYCIGASNGNQIWNQTGQFYMFTVSNGDIYVGDLSVVSCLNASDGVQLWNYSTDNAYSSSPVVVGGMVYVDGYNLNREGGLVYAFNASTGAEIWNYSSPADTRFGPIGFTANGNVLETSLVVAGGYVYAVSRGAVYALNVSTGKELWDCPTSGQLSSLIADGTNVYVSCDYSNVTATIAGGIICLGAQNGSLIWNYTSQSSVGSFAFANGTIYLISSNGLVHALDASRGTVIWNYTTGLSLGSSLIANSYLYIGSSAGMYCFDMSNGTVVWNFTGSGFAAVTNPTYADGVVYVGYNGGGPPSNTQHNFYALDALNGKILWNYTIEYTVASPPVVAHGTVYIAANYAPVNLILPGNNGAVFALKPESAHWPFSATTILIIVIIVTVITISTVVFIFRKKTKN